MPEIPDIILHDPNNVSQKLVRGRKTLKIEKEPEYKSAFIMKDTKSTGGGGGKGGGNQPKKSVSVKGKNKAPGYVLLYNFVYTHIKTQKILSEYPLLHYIFSFRLSARSKSVSNKKAQDGNAAEEAEMEAAIMAQLELDMEAKLKNPKDVPATGM